MPSVDIGLLGRFRVTVDGVPIPDGQWNRRSAAALVKVLAMTPQRRMHREQLIDVLWPDDSLDAACAQAAQGGPLCPPGPRDAGRGRPAGGDGVAPSGRCLHPP